MNVHEEIIKIILDGALRSQIVGPGMLEMVYKVPGLSPEKTGFFVD
jgi:hypothetical protein